jgi:hypothetical protein
MTANGMVRPCSGPASEGSWQWAAKTRDWRVSDERAAGAVVLDVEVARRVLPKQRDVGDLCAVLDSKRAAEPVCGFTKGQACLLLEGR